LEAAADLLVVLARRHKTNLPAKKRRVVLISFHWLVYVKLVFTSLMRWNN
jgi:hypothetical protein